MLSRALTLLVGAVTLLGSTGCTGLTKPESIAIIAEPAPEPAAPKPAAEAQAPVPQRQQAAQAPQPAQANCGE
ncbi:MAG: hypothetical protein ABJE95_21440 [Byssovorax sp.]